MVGIVLKINISIPLLGLSTQKSLKCYPTYDKVILRLKTWGVGFIVRRIFRTRFDISNHIFSFSYCALSENPDPREDLESRSPNLGPYTTKGTL